MTDREILRELARAYMEAAADPVNDERRTRAKAANSLKTGLRPLVWIDEVPWHEMNFDKSLTLQCKDERARQAETCFRRTLYRRKYMPADMVVEPYYLVRKSWTSTGNGAQVHEHKLSNDENNTIYSHSYIDMLETDEQVDALHMPVIEAQPERDAENLAYYNEMFGDIVPVVLFGTAFYTSPWDNLSMLRGVEPCYIDMIDRPEFMHKTLKKLFDGEMTRLEQMEKLNLLDMYTPELHCTPGYVDEMQEDHSPVPSNRIWIRAMAQMLSSVSPEMFEEFELNYEKKLFEKCGLVYYGCCEPLDNFLPALMKVPNMRKLGVSPWANAEKCAEMMGSRYIAACKPNPAMVSGTLDEDAAAKDVEKFVKACIKNNTPYDLVIKDISTVTYKPENLFRWSEIAEKVLDKYY